MAIKKPPIRHTPLSIIALFVALTEAVAGYAMTQADGNLQMIFGFFLVAFPTLLLLLFFFVLWHRPYVYYPPHEFDGKTDVGQFVDAMQRRSDTQSDIINRVPKTVLDVLDSEETRMALSSLKNEAASTGVGDAGKANEVFENIAKRTAEAIQGDFIVLDAGPEFGSRQGRYYIPYRPSDSFLDFGDE